MTRTDPGRRRGTGRTVSAIVRSARPRHWVKNVLVLAAPALSGRITEPPVLVATAIAFVCFCLAASGTYLVNDARDVEADRLHPVKRHRPVAAGDLRPRTAYLAGGAMITAALLVAALQGWPLLLVIGAYAAISAGVLLRAQERATHRHRRHRVGVPPAGGRGRSRSRHPPVAVVHPRDVLRLAVHGGGQEVRRDQRLRDPARVDAGIAGDVLPHLHPLRVDTLRRCADHDVRAVGVRPAGGAGLRAAGALDLPRSSSRSCATRSTSTVGPPASRRRSWPATGGCSRSASCGSSSWPGRWCSEPEPSAHQELERPSAPPGAPGCGGVTLRETAGSSRWARYQS